MFLRSNGMTIFKVRELRNKIKQLHTLFVFYFIFYPIKHTIASVA